MKHRFYNKSKKEQNSFFVILAIVAIIIITFSILISLQTGIYLIAAFTFSLTLSIIAPFFDTPTLKKSGKLTYYSSLFLAENPKNKTVKIHGGTLFDYYFVIDKEMNGKQRTKFIIQQYMQGLLCLIEEYKDVKEMKIQGTSYILNRRTAEKIGFKIVNPDLLQKAILTYNYPNILISNSIAKKQLSFPNLNRTKTFETDISLLIEREDYIKKLNKSLKSSISQTG